MNRTNLPLFESYGYEEKYDQKRLTRQSERVYNVMKDGHWRTLGEIKSAIGGGSETGISATLRSFRQSQFGGHTLNKRRRADPHLGLWEYSLIERHY